MQLELALREILLLFFFFLSFFLSDRGPRSIIGCLIHVGSFAASLTGSSVWPGVGTTGSNGCLLAETEQSLLYRGEAN